jgi:SagB-type dehydrogenase family enzyme
MSTTPHSSAAETLTPAAYHERTKHRFEAYAAGPGQLDWDRQPAPFRQFAGAPRVVLPLAGEAFEQPFAELGQVPAQPVTLASVAALLELSLGLSAWKCWGPNRWALRCNPSSGNLHPVEAYVLASGLSEIGDGLHHYEPEQHALEGRALLPPQSGGPWLALALSSVTWREVWKYGERAFRYCELDVGHAAAALAYAAALLGWRLRPWQRPDAELAEVLGLNRAEDFPAGRYAYTEVEEPELLLWLEAPGLNATPPASLVDWLAGATWHGTPSRIDAEPGYRWPVIAQAAAASRRVTAGGLSAAAGLPLPPLTPLAAGNPGTAQLIRQRRSAQRFNPVHTLLRAAFFRLLDATLPRSGQPPWAAVEPADPAAGQPAVHLLLFVLRVEGLPSGLYLLPREPVGGAALLAAMSERDERFAQWQPVTELAPDCPPHLGLLRLTEVSLPEMQRLARALSCHQDIAATSAFSLGMLADFTALTTDPHAYRRLLREAGAVGQVLYLEAEAAGVRGTGIGCFFDDPVRQVAGLDGGASGERWQSVYHFTVGEPVVDGRIETEVGYGE